jgi:hypothetical protein
MPQRLERNRTGPGGRYSNRLELGASGGLAAPRPITRRLSSEAQIDFQGLKKGSHAATAEAVARLGVGSDLSGIRVCLVLPRSPLLANKLHLPTPQRLLWSSPSRGRSAWGPGEGTRWRSPAERLELGGRQRSHDGRSRPLSEYRSKTDDAAVPLMEKKGLLPATGVGPQLPGRHPRLRDGCRPRRGCQRPRGTARCGSPEVPASASHPFVVRGECRATRSASCRILTSG